MFTVVLTVVLLLGVGWALGRAPLHRGLLLAAALLVWLPTTALWVYLVDASDLDRWLRARGFASDGWGAAVYLLPPLLLTLELFRRLRRRQRPRFLWAGSGRPATLSLRGIGVVQGSVLLIVLLGGNLAASFRERGAAAAWAAAGQPLAALDERFPKTPTNAAGLELQRRAASLGIAVDPASDAAASRRALHGRVGDAITSYVFREARRPEGVPAAAPLEVRAWLAMSADGLAAVADHLRGAGPVVFATDLDAGRPYPLGGLRDLHGALLAAAYEAIRAGRTGEASSALEAAWLLTASLRGRPGTADRLLALVQDRHWLGAVRALGAVPEGWERRLEAMGDARGVLEAPAVDARSFLEDARGPRTTLRGLFLEANWSLALLGEGLQSRWAGTFLALSGGPVGMGEIGDAIGAERERVRRPFYRFLQGPLEKPYLRLCAADYARASADAYAQVVRSDACAPLPEPGEATALAAWNLVAERALSARRLARSVAQVGAEVELTRHVLRARALRAADPDLRWPHQLPGLESGACPGRRFVYEAPADGSASVRLEPNPFDPQEATVSFRMDGR